MKRILHLIFLLLVIVACEEVFDPPPQAFLNANIQYTDDNQNIEKKEVAVSVYGIDNEEIWINEDTIKYDNDTVRSILLPLNTLNLTEFVFILNGMYDTVQFISQTETVYESMESGFYTRHKLDEVNHTTNRIDEIEITDSLVTKDWNENIIIYINNRISSTN